MNKHSNRCAMALALLVGLSACSQPDPTPLEPVQEVRTCESIRDDVIALTEKNPVSIVKIYEPTVVMTKPKKVSCSGRAMLSNSMEATVYYRAFEDPEGGWLVEYSENTLEKTGAK